MFRVGRRLLHSEKVLAQVQGGNLINLITLAQVQTTKADPSKMIRKRSKRSVSRTRPTSRFLCSVIFKKITKTILKMGGVLDEQEAAAP